MIRNVFLDADDTLFDFRRSEKKALSETLTRFGIEPTEEVLSRYHEINAAHWRMLERREITRAELKLRRYQCLFDEYGIACSASEVADCYEERLGDGHFFIDGAEALLRALSPRYRLYITSNGYSKTQRGRLKSAQIDTYLTDVFISQELGVDKPDVGFFEACFARIPDCKREETVIVGDSLTSDIRGGINAGIKTVWFRHGGMQARADIRPDFEIRQLSELPALLTKL